MKHFLNALVRSYQIVTP